jgi:hypothetical protein
MGSAVAVEDGEEVHGRAVDPGEEARLEGDGVLHLAHLPGRELHGRRRPRAAPAAARSRTGVVAGSRGGHRGVAFAAVGNIHAGASHLTTYDDLPVDRSMKEREREECGKLKEETKNLAGVFIPGRVDGRGCMRAVGGRHVR